jgi:hypothetical protein
MTTLTRLSEQFAVYEDVKKLFEANRSTRLDDSLKRVYIDLFQFLTSIVRIFTKKDGGE